MFLAALKSKYKKYLSFNIIFFTNLKRVEQERLAEFVKAKGISITKSDKAFVIFCFIF